jgi:PAS domain S-box-containing protein
MKVTMDKNTGILQGIDMHQKASEEMDTTMKYRTDALGYVVKANRAFLETFGYNESDVYGYNWENHIDKRDLQNIQIRWERARQTKSEFISIHGIIDMDDVIHRCSVRGVPLLTDSGELRGYYVTVLEKTVPTKKDTEEFL